MLRRILLAFVLTVSAGCVSVDENSSGEEIFASLCARCHGSDLQGGVGPSLAAGSNASDQDDEFLITTIHRGRGSMPSFDRTLDDAQIERVVAYLRERQAE